MISHWSNFFEQMCPLRNLYQCFGNSLIKLSSIICMFFHGTVINQHIEIAPFMPNNSFCQERKTHEVIVLSTEVLTWCGYVSEQLPILLELVSIKWSPASNPSAHLLHWQSPKLVDNVDYLPKINKDIISL